MIFTGCSTLKNNVYDFLGGYERTGLEIAYKLINDAKLTKDQLNEIDGCYAWAKSKGFPFRANEIQLTITKAKIVPSGNWGFEDKNSPTGWSGGCLLSSTRPQIKICNKNIASYLCHEFTHYIIKNDPNHTDLRWKEWRMF
jgi:hypothetical protein